MADTPWNRVWRKGESILEEIIQQAYDHSEPNVFDSPIEETFAIALNVQRLVLYREVDWRPQAHMTFDELRQAAKLPGDPKVAESLWDNRHFACAAPQVRVGNYRVDFMIIHRNGISDVSGVVVECDGHDFHEKTKEQAARDRARDRELQDMGFKVYRFTGSEIWNDPLECACSVLSVAHSIGLDSELARDCQGRGDNEGVMIALRYILQQ